MRLNFLLVLVQLTVPICFSLVTWYEVLEPELLQQHGLKDAESLTSFTNALPIQQSLGLVVVCKEFNKHNGGDFNQWHNRHKHDLHPIHIKKSSSSLCFLGEMSRKQIAQFSTNEPQSSVTVLPAVLKIHQSVLQYVRDKVSPPPLKKTTSPEPAVTTSALLNMKKTESSSRLTDPGEGLVLSFEFSPFATQRESMRSLASTLFGSFSNPDFSIFNEQLNAHSGSDPTNTLTWADITRTQLGTTTTPPCVLTPSTNSIQITSRSVEIVDLRNITLTCVVQMVQIASLLSDVLRITLTSRPTLMNLEARTHIQTGRANKEPYREDGLTGAGQVCGVADSGLNDLSCYFVDDSGAYDSSVTSRMGVVETQRRKIIQYTSYADSFDTQGGHGTHVCGSIAGHSLDEFSNMNGVAPEAKISFFDVGMTDRPFLLIPPLELLFNTQYNATARVHSNSWGSTVGVYSQNSYEVDAFTYTHDESLILFAAGNSGAMGLKSIISPANAKNCVSVGAGQLRATYDDSLFGANNYTVAYFSSLGPTFDGRIKPDIIAPGDAIMSAYAGDLSTLKAAISGSSSVSGSNGYSVDTTCAVHQLDGTSMATPLVSGTALLIRQYFMDSAFWATLCNKHYTTCKRGSFTPSGYLLKSLILHSGRAVPLYSNPLYDMQNTFSSFALSSPPDFFQGYGEIQLTNILPLANNRGLEAGLDLVVFDRLEIGSFSTIQFDIDFTQVLTQQRSQYYSHNTDKNTHNNRDTSSDTLRSDTTSSPSTSSAVRPLKITLVWYDPPSLLGSGASLLIHDLDLVVVGPSGDVYQGNKNGVTFNRFTTSAEKLQQVDTTSDEVNPNEQITIPLPLCAQGGGEGGAEGRRSEDCVYKVYVQSYALTVKEQQAFALVITTDGLVTDPVYIEGVTQIVPSKKRDSFSTISTTTTTQVDNNNTDTNTNTDTTNTNSITTHMNTVLHNNEYISTDVGVNTCSQLDSIEVRLHYDILSQHSTRKDEVLTYDQVGKMYLSLVDPEGRIVIVGETFDSVEVEEEGMNTKNSDINNKANNNAIHNTKNSKQNTLFLHWPIEWKSHNSGHYSARVYVRQHTKHNAVTGLHGVGNWSMRIMNGGSSDRFVGIYNVTVVMLFDENTQNTPCSSAHDIVSTDTDTTTVSSDNTKKTGTNNIELATNPKPTETYITHTIPFANIMLGVVMTGWFNLKQDRVLLDTITQNSAVLQSVSLSLSGYQQSGQMSRGMDAWLLAVIVTAPNELVVQSGGFEWLGEKDLFYNRRWPDLWLGKASSGYNWVATRDVRAARLESVDRVVEVNNSTLPRRSEEEVQHQSTDDNSNNNNQWSIELAMGYSLSIKPRTDFSGNITLVFKTKPRNTLNNNNGNTDTIDGDENKNDNTQFDSTTPIITQYNETITDLLPKISEHEFYHNTQTTTARVIVVCIMFLTVFVMFVQFVKHHKRPYNNNTTHNKNTTYTPHSQYSYTQINSQCNEDGLNYSGTLNNSNNNNNKYSSMFASYQQQPTVTSNKTTILDKHLNKDETPCLVHTCVKNHHSENDLTLLYNKTNTQQNNSNSYKAYHSCGKEQHKIQNELMPNNNNNTYNKLTRNSNNARSTNNLLNNIAENTPLFTMLKSLKTSNKNNKLKNTEENNKNEKRSEECKEGSERGGGGGGGGGGDVMRMYGSMNV